MENENNHIIAIIVENKPGVLYGVANMFRRRGFNLDSISVGPTEQADLARMTVTVRGDDKTIEQVTKQLGKLIDVVKVSRLNPASIVTREMALVKVRISEAKATPNIMNYVDVFRGRIVDMSRETLMVEITGGSEKIDAFIELMKPFGITELARTGVTALSRGSKSVGIMNNGGK
jgi:acetolactate synthase-1/3 small subunit